ncbi:MAG: phosphatase PAP2 family protein [Bacilli bacterium]
MKNLKNINFKNKKTIILFVSLILFIFLTYNIFNNKIAFIDSYIEGIILSIRNDKLTDVMTIITNISSAYALIVITILLLILIKNKKIPILITFNLIFSFLTSQLIKIILRRDRPVDISLVNAVGFSYPSGHSMVSMAYFGFIAYLVYKYIDNTIVKVILIITLFISIIDIGFSRIYLGVHYFSDVLGGFLLSISYLMLFININKFNLSEVKQ